MKILFALVAFMVGAATSFAELLFQGYMMTEGTPLLVLSIDKQRSSGWLRVGQTFDGFSIVAFDAKNEVLSVEKDGKRQEIPIARGRINATSEAPGQPNQRPILILLGTGEQISVGDDAGMIEALKDKLKAVAAMSPQPKVTLRPPRGSTIDSLKLIMDACREAGIKRFDLSTQ